MPLSERVRSQAESTLAKFCQNHTPQAMVDQVRLEYEIHGFTAFLFERRRPWPLQRSNDEWSKNAVARFRFAANTAKWTLDWPDSNSRWHRYEFTSAATLAGLLREVDRDPTGIFLGLDSVLRADPQEEASRCGRCWQTALRFSTARRPDNARLAFVSEFTATTAPTEICTGVAVALLYGCCKARRA